MALVKPAVIFFAECRNYRHGPDAMKLNRNVPLRGNADTKRRVSAPPAHGINDDAVATRLREAGMYLVVILGRYYRRCLMAVRLDLEQWLEEH